jgi:predicted kinase
MTTTVVGGTPRRWLVRPFILSGGPAVGKSTCGRRLSRRRERGAFIDVDDIRQLVVSGERTLWSGAEGERQLLLAARNTSALGRNLVAAGFDVVAADFVTPDSLRVYREQLPDCFVVHLAISRDGALRRAATRPVHLTDDEFDLLHRLIETPPQADVVLDVEGFTVDEQAQAISELWMRA